MDPRETLVRILKLCSIAEPDLEVRAELVDSLDNLQSWIENGGFIPHVTFVDYETRARSWTIQERKG